MTAGFSPALGKGNSNAIALPRASLLTFPKDPLPDPPAIILTGSFIDRKMNFPTPLR
jgi:hypothetical protein